MLSRRRTLGAMGILAGLVLVSWVAIYCFNYVSLQRPMNAVVSDDPRNSSIVIQPRYGSYIDTSTVILDLRRIPPGASRADVFRVVLQYAEAMQDHRFERVVFAFRGEDRMYIDGDYFAELGDEYGSQNPVYTIRTFPEHVHRMDGKPAFGQWTGGLLGVLKEQMDDHNEFHDRWYLRDIN